MDNTSDINGTNWNDIEFGTQRDNEHYLMLSDTATMSEPDHREHFAGTSDAKKTTSYISDKTLNDKLDQAVDDKISKAMHDALKQTDIGDITEDPEEPPSNNRAMIILFIVIVAAGVALYLYKKSQVPAYQQVYQQAADVPQQMPPQQMPPQ